MLKIKKLSKSYIKGKKVVDELDLTLEDGDIFGFIGHNGAGKTTTIKCITGALAFEEGEIFINNISLKDDPVKYKENIAYVSDSPNSYTFLKGIEYLNFIGDIFSLSGEERTKEIKKYADMFELTSVLGDPIESYSHGMKQKINLISSLMHKPKVLILDEPFTGLDPQSSYNLKKTMEELTKSGSLIFFSTHILEIAEKLCNKIGIIENGKLILNGKTDEILQGKTLEEITLNKNRKDI